MDFKKIHQEAYKRPSFSAIYLQDRAALYDKIADILKGFKIGRVLDVGCSFGLLTEACAQRGFDAYGLDFDFEELRLHHETLPLSKGKYIYGAFGEPETMAKIDERQFDAILFLDTIRYIPDLTALDNSGIKYILIKEISRREKQSKNPKFGTVRNLADYKSALKNYSIDTAFPSRYLFKVRRPGSLVCNMMNKFFPTYTVILKRQGG